MDTGPVCVSSGSGHQDTSGGFLGSGGPGASVRATVRANLWGCVPSANSELWLYGDMVHGPIPVIPCQNKHLPQENPLQQPDAQTQPSVHEDPDA